MIGSGREEAGFDKEYVTAEKEDGEWDEKKDKRRKYVILFSVLAVLTITGSITAARFIQEHHSADAAKTDMLVNEVAVQITGISEDEIVILSTEEEIGLKRMIIEGILSLQAGDSPTAIEAKLMVFIPQSEREGLKTEG